VLNDKEKEKEKKRKEAAAAATAIAADTAGGNNTNNSTLISTSTISRKKEKDQEYKALKFSNNLIIDMSVIFPPLQASPLLHIDPEKICWIDISFNNIETIFEAFLVSVPNLCTLNLHANQIARLSDIKRLACFKKLRSLTLCGNPVAENKHYRNMILYFCSETLVQLDFGCITNSERKKVAIWEQVYRKKLHPDDS
jgi:hypothetical protein